MEWKVLAAKLAAMGLPVLGRAVGTLVGGQVPIFGGMIEGAGENIGAAAARMIADALGVEPTAEEITHAIEGKPTSEVMTALQSAESEAAAKWPAIAAIVASLGDEYKAALEDNEKARQQMVELAQMNAPQQWGAPIVSVIVTTAFTLVMLLWIFTPPTGDAASIAILNILVGTLAAAFGQVVSYWLGSSASSKDKDSAFKAALIGSQMPTQQTVAPPPKVTPPPAKKGK